MALSGLAKPSEIERKITIFGLTLFLSGNTDACQGLHNHLLINQRLAALLSAYCDLYPKDASCCFFFHCPDCVSRRNGIGNWRRTPPIRHA